MSPLSRIGISIDSELLSQFDSLIEKMGYSNRSEAFRDLIRDKLISERQEVKDDQSVGVVSIVYDHHKKEISDRIVEMQHEFGESIITSMHVHLDKDNCLEVIIARGRASRVKSIADRLIGTKGVKHGRLAMTSTGEGLQ